MEPRYYLQDRQDGAFFLPVCLSRIIFALLTFPSPHARFFPLHYSRLVVSKAGFPVVDFPRSPLVRAASARATCVCLITIAYAATLNICTFYSRRIFFPCTQIAVLPRTSFRFSLFCKLHNSKRAAILMQSR